MNKISVCLKKLRSYQRFICVILMYLSLLTFFGHYKTGRNFGHEIIRASSLPDTEFPNKEQHLQSFSEQDANQNESKRERVKNVFVFTFCKSTKEDAKLAFGKKEKISFERQLEQSAMMIKSAVALTNQTLKFIAFTESEQLFRDLQLHLQRHVPHQYKGRIELTYQKVWYPKDKENIRAMFRACSTERLFMLEVLKNLDAIVYLDTDIIFMRPPEELWQQFRYFKEEESVGLSQRLFENFIHSEVSIPYYGETGLNAGVMLMNMTRMENFPGGWIESNLEIINKLGKHLKYGDQDVLNILFKEHPNQLYDLRCNWNIRIANCKLVKTTCQPAVKNGVSIIHGSGAKFFQGKNYGYYLKFIFKAWKEYRLGDPLQGLVAKMEKELDHADIVNPLPYCPGYGDLKNNLLKGLKSLL